MATSTMRVSDTARVALERLAEQDGLSMSDALESVLAREADRRFLEAGFAELDAGPVDVVAAYDAEFASWDAAELTRSSSGRGRERS